VLVRVQVDISEGRMDCEIWDVDGTNYRIHSSTGLTFVAATEINGSLPGFITGSGNLGFMRGYTTLVPLKSRPPVTADVGTYFDWKLDGNGNDSSGNGRTLSTASASFVETPGQNTFALPSTPNTPFWAPFVPLRAGFANQLDGTASYSMADGSAEVTCAWQQIPHSNDEPLTSVVKFGDRTSCQPVVSGLVFGPYRFRLTVTATNNTTATADLDVGAVAYDDNGVVIYPDERLNDLLGPTMVLGANPWEWLDKEHVNFAQARWARYEVFGGTWDSEMNPPNRTFNGIPRQGTVWIDFSGRPTKARGIGTNFLRVFSAGRAGPPLVTAATPLLLPEVARSRDFHTVTRNYTVTNVVSDTEMDILGEIPIAEADAVPWHTQWLAGVQEGATGTVYADPGVEIRKVYGTGTNFLSEFCGGVVGPSTSNLQRILIADSAVSLRYQVASCESDTELTLVTDFTGSAIAAPGVPWRREDGVNRGEWRTGQIATFVNFYDAVAADWSLYYRTGWKDARTAARWMFERHWKQWEMASRNWGFLGSLISFELDQGYTSSQKQASDRDLFWSLGTRIIAEAILRNGCVGSGGISDVRESAYCFERLAFITKYSPDAADRTAAINALVDDYTDMVGNSLHSSGAVLARSGASADASGRWWAVTNGSATVTKEGGDDAPADFCGDPASFYSSGTLAIGGAENRTVTLTGGDWTGQGNKMIYLRGTRDGQPYSQANRIMTSPAPNASGGTLYYPWPGDGNPTAYRIQTFDANFFKGNIFSFRASADGTNTVPMWLDVDHWHWCTVDSGTQLTLDRPWTGPTGYRRFQSSDNGTGMSSLLYGIFAMAMYRVADALQPHNATAAGNYRFAGDEQIRFLKTLQDIPGIGQWAYLPTFSSICEPRTTWPNYCYQVSAPTVNGMRSWPIETSRALAMQYQYLRDTGSADAPAALTYLNIFYQRLFARTGFAAPVAGDGNWNGTIDEANWGSSVAQLYKNYGQAYGMGGTQMFPAEREGGPAASARLKNSTVSFDGNVAPMATSYRVNVLFPSGQKQQTVCTESPCTVQIDPRQGTHLITKEWLDASGKVIRRSDPEPILIKIPGQGD
jgi:hypothetical protein